QLNFHLLIYIKIQSSHLVTPVSFPLPTYPKKSFLLIMRYNPGSNFSSVQSFSHVFYTTSPIFVGHENASGHDVRSEEHTSELQSRFDLVCRLLLEKKNKLQQT